LVGSFAYIAGQFPTSQYLGPYLPDVIGSLVCFAALLGLLKIWKPRTTMGFGGRDLTDEEIEEHRRSTVGEGGASTGRSPLRGLLPFGILIVVVVAWTGPWSSLPKYIPFAPKISALSSLAHEAVSTTWKFAPFVAGTAILVCWVLISLYLRPNRAQLRKVFVDSFRQIWGALLVGPLIFGLAEVYNYSGMANSMANGFAKLGTWFLVLSPVLGWIAVALSGSNTSSNAVFGQFQYTVARLLHAPVLLFPSLNSLGAEVGKPVAPQTASVGVSTTRFVRNEGQVIRYNMGWTLVILAYLICIGILFYFVFPGAVSL
jgi:lactate permease